jgi:hypothetical protein
VSDERPRSRMRDFWQLDVPLVLALIMCTTFTVIEVMRAAEGVWRAWVYMVEWPLIGAFCVWMWVRFKREPGGGFARKWRERADRIAQEAQQAQEAQVAPEEPDPELAAWREYQRTLDREQGPGQ